MNQPYEKQETFLDELKKMIEETPLGQALTITFDGHSRITCYRGAKKIKTIENVTTKFAMEVQFYLEMEDFNFKRFRISPYAFEATLKKVRGRR